jgi:hypothetical protein
MGGGSLALPVVAGATTLTLDTRSGVHCPPVNSGGFTCTVSGCRSDGVDPVFHCGGPRGRQTLLGWCHIGLSASAQQSVRGFPKIQPCVAHIVRVASVNCMHRFWPQMCRDWCAAQGTKCGSRFSHTQSRFSTLQYCNVLNRDCV